MANNLDWTSHSFDTLFSRTQLPEENELLPHQFLDYQLPPTQQMSPSYHESINYNNSPGYTDLSNMASTYEQPTYPNGNYLPSSQPSFPNSMASALPVLGPDLVNAVLNGGDDINSSIERMSLENGRDPMSAQQRLAQFTSVVGSMDSGSTSGSISNASALINEAAMLQPKASTDYTAPPHHIEILEEPMEFGYRFRYEVEGKAHGGLQGQTSKNNGTKRANKIYPEIQVCNVPNHINEVEIEARLVSATEDFYPHPNKCSGKDCNEKGVFRKILKRTEHPNFRLQLNNLTILQIKKGDQATSLIGQLEEISDHEKKLNLQNRMVTDIKAKADELAKCKHNGVVRIRFEASYFDPLLNAWQVAAKHSISVHDQKQTNAAELRICRISASSSPAAGGVEVFLLCEKVTRDDIKVKFQHENWEADGTFMGTDVHYQYAIVFRVPPYKKLDIKGPVGVHLKLFRPSTNTYSKHVTFTYHPNHSAEEMVQRKKRRIEASGPANMGGYKPYSSPFSDCRAGSSDGAGSSHFMPANGGGSYGNPSPNYCKQSSPTAAHTSDEMPMDLSKSNVLPSTIDEVAADSVKVKVEKEEAKGDAKESIKEEVTSDTSRRSDDESDVDDVEADGTMYLRKSPVIVTPVPHAKLSGSHKCVKTMAESSDEPLKAAKNKPVAATRLSVVPKETNTKERRMESHIEACEDFVVESLMNYAVSGDHLYFIAQFRYFLGVKDEHGDNSLHLAVINCQIKALTDILSICSATKTTVAVNQLNDRQQTPILVAAILKCPDMVDVLLKNEADPTITDSTGSNCFHVAAQNKDHKIMQLLCRWIVGKSLRREALNDLDYSGQSALHKAVHSDSIDCIQELIRAGADVNQGDGTSGKTALHYTVESSNIVNMTALLVCPSIDVNIAAYDGNTPLHLAVSGNRFNITKLLIQFGADPDIRNRELFSIFDDEEIHGLDAYELCHGNEQMLAVIGATPARNTKPPMRISNDRIQSLPEKTFDRLSTLLDCESEDWKRLAAYFDVSPLIHYMEKEANPTRKLFNYLEHMNKAIRDVKTGLRSIGRQDCVEVIDGPSIIDLPRSQNKSGISFKDSGLGEDS
ncbi:nuclear factor NF-kappa-B p100 subunit-like [Watersipora subatra]|uniref:nuclear factor NF-kappa-B p100 subunit-like n=1 Tax=Watersipora subatra TaxID=2589382 RepID=UPI00355B667E